MRREAHHDHAPRDPYGAQRPRPAQSASGATYGPISLRYVCEHPEVVFDSPMPPKEGIVALLRDLSDSYRAHGTSPRDQGAPCTGQREYELLCRVAEAYRVLNDIYAV